MPIRLDFLLVDLRNIYSDLQSKGQKKKKNKKKRRKKEEKSSENDQITGYFKSFFLILRAFFNISKANSSTSKVNQQLS